VYHCLLPTLTDGSTTSPNIFSTRGTGLTLLETSFCPQRAADYSYPKN
jgi:hypothetical protein